MGLSLLELRIATVAASFRERAKVLERSIQGYAKFQYWVGATEGGIIFEVSLFTNENTWKLRRIFSVDEILDEVDTDGFERKVVALMDILVERDKEYVKRSRAAG